MNSLVSGSGCGTREWREDFKLTDASGNSILKVPQTPASGEMVINDGSVDMNLRVESNGNANALFIDAGADRVGIFTAAPTVPLDVTGNTLITGDLVVTGSITGGSVIDSGGNFVFNETGAAIDARFEGDTDANLLFTDGSADRVGVGTATPATKLDVAGTVTATGADLNGAVVVNESGADADFRVEGDTDTDLLLVDASTDAVHVGVLYVDTQTPATAGAAGIAGTIAWDADYIYVATATNTWKRAAISTWP